MIAVIALAMLRQRLTSPLRLVILGMVFASSWAAGAFMKSLAPLEGAAGMFALTLAAGGIGQEVASGTLTLTFARPLTRTSYVFGRWAGATLFAAACVMDREQGLVCWKACMRLMSRMMRDAYIGSMIGELRQVCWQMRDENQPRLVRWAA